MKRRVADIIMDILVDENITDCFAVVGGGAMHLNNALALNGNVHVYFNHHEQACAMAAESYARISGKIAAVCVTSGPGTTNTLTGVMGAYQDSIPLLVISGQVRYATMAIKTGLPLRYRGIQEFNIVPVVESFTKYATMITDPLSIKKELLKAIKIALEGRRGPVWIDIPLDIQSAVIETEELYPADYESEIPTLSTEDAADILAALRSSKRPCVLGGTGIISSNTKDKFIKFIEKLNIPVVGGGWCTDMMGTDHPLYFGLSGDIGPRTGNFILQNADTILVLGNSLSFRQTGFAQELFAPHARILYIDVDEAESLKPGLRITHFYHSDLEGFFRVIATHDISSLNKSSWLEYCCKLKHRFSVFESITDLNMKERVNSYYFWKIFDQFISEDQVITMGNSRVNAAKIQIGVKTQSQRAITNYLCGSMGYDLPAAIGAAVATKKEIICITGDGSIMMNLQELETITHNQLPVKVIVFSNDGYEAIRQTHKNFFGGRYVGCTPDTGVGFPDFQKLSAAFGFKYMLCKTNEEVENSIKYFMAEKEPVFMEILQRIDNPLIPKLMSKMNEDGSFSTPAIHDMAPFLSKEEINDLMLWEKDDE
ncbi:thiamine pyrophosphate-binding protein [Luxibacter massiliensis]|uniref:thiamine pyrophosphate-binding protein n=1 Tax=Luxibacter massiliensis TaxID=2219695 RepID=UPI000F04C73A|nr:thiamine pyrophosphate-binding protein [Luxibacter massiliensis]